MSRKPVMVLLAMLASLLLASHAPAVYHVETGRFLQKDPHATGLPILGDAGWLHGRAPLVPVSAFNLRQHFRDGMNTYEYLRSSPLNRSDPLGLYSTAWMASLAPGIAANILQNALMGAAASATNAGIWAVNFTASGALVVGYNFDNIMMFAQNADANWDNWINEFSRRGVTVDRHMNVR